MKAVVLGSGVIGTTSAYFLARKGFEVHVIDRQPEVAMETSFANGGVLHTSEAEPWSRPGMPRAVLSWLGKENAPMLLRLREVPFMWRWGVDFIRNCSVERFRQAAAANLRLANHSLDMIRAVRAETSVRYDLAQKGTLKIYTRREALDKSAEEASLQRPLGLVFEVLSADRCVEVEPALAPIRDSLAGGIFAPRDEHGDCHKFSVGLRRYCQDMLGVRFHLKTEIKSLARDGNRIEAVTTSAGREAADVFVAAMGSFTPALLKPLGIRLSICPAKGVTVTVRAAGWPDGPQVPIIDDTRLFGLVRLGDTYRCTGSVEFTGWDARPNPARSKALVDNVKSVFPGFGRCYNQATAQVWSGFRPMASSGNPYIGATPIKNLYLNCGHGHLGWTLSCGSSKALADIISGGIPAIDMTGLTLATHS